jgi:hypothetical protein
MPPRSPGAGQKADQEHADAATGPDADWQLTWAGDDTPPGPPRIPVMCGTYGSAPTIQNRTYRLGERSP